MIRLGIPRALATLLHPSTKASAPLTNKTNPTTNNKISKKSLVAQFIKNEEDEEVINELEQELKHRKEILAKKRDN